MNKAERDFLLQLDTKLKKLYSKGMPTVEQLMDDVSRRRVPLASYNNKPTKQDLEFVKGATTALKNIQRVVNSPDTMPEQKQIITPASNARSVDGRCLVRTMRDTSLWVRNEIGEMEPENVYSNVIEDSYDTYENCFVKQLIDKTLDIINSKLYMSYQRMSSVDKLSQVNTQNTDIFSAVSALTSGSYGRLSLLSKDNDKGLLYIEQLNDLRTRYTRLMRSPFYGNVTQGNVNIDRVILTDAINSDAHLHQLYQYWSMYIGNSTSVDVSDSMLDDCYYNYVLLRIMALFGKLGYKYYRPAGRKPTMVRTTKADNKLKVATITYKYKSFTVSIVAKKHGIYIDTRYIRKDIVRMPDHAQQIKSRLYLFVSTLDFATKFQVEKAMLNSQKMAGEKSICTNCLLVSPHGATGNPNLVLAVSPVSQYTNHKLEDFGKTLTTLLPGSSKIYSRKCPICGDNQVTYEYGSMRCAVCATTWSVFVKKKTDKGMVFIKKLGGDTYYNNKIKDLRATRAKLKQLREQNKQLKLGIMPKKRSRTS